MRNSLENTEKNPYKKALGKISQKPKEIFFGKKLSENYPINESHFLVHFLVFFKDLKNSGYP